MELPQPPPLPTLAEPPRPRFYPFWVGVALLALGVMALAVGAAMDMQAFAGNPWRDAVLVSGEQPPWEGMRPGRLRPILHEEMRVFDEALRAEPDGAQYANALQLMHYEDVLLLDLTPDEWKTLLGGGPVPQSGAFEAAAGVWCRSNSFTLDGQVFQATSRIPRETPFLAFTYVLPFSPDTARFFADEAGGETVWLDLQGRQRLEALSATEQGAIESHLAISPAPAPSGAVRWAISGMALAALGGSLAWLTLFRRIPAKRLRIWGAVFQDMQAFPRLFQGLHVMLYGVFFASMLLACQFPLWNCRAGALMKSMFVKGDLAFIGQAYAAGDIVRAAVATWLWNYGAATLGLSLLPSLVIPCWGLLKNLASFAVVGFAMPPIWSGSIAPMTYHIGTMVLELEGYILVSFMAVAYVIHGYRLIQDGHVKAHGLHALAMMADGAALIGIILALAAVYEAVTLILFHF